VAGRLYKADFTCAPWYKALNAPRGPPVEFGPRTAWGARVDSLEPGGRMAAGSCLVSKNGVYAACVQCDGNFVVSQTKSPYDFTQGATQKWASSTSGVAGASLNFMLDGNVNLVDANGQVAVWSSLTTTLKAKATSNSVLTIQVWGVQGFGCRGGVRVSERKDPNN
jgi:hypothetical protein